MHRFIWCLRAASCLLGYYDLKEASIKFTLPEPGFLEGVKSKDRAILKMHSVGFT